MGFNQGRLDMEVRKGRFYNISKKEKEKYIGQLMHRVRSGYYDSEKVIEGVLDKLIDTFEDGMDHYYQTY